MTSRLVLLLTLLAGFAFAQDGVTRGDALRRREFRTFAAVTLFVDPTGNDANACTASGTAACLTVNGAIAKLPKVIQHNVTINVAAGTYAGFTVSNFIFTAPTTGGLTFSIVGAMQNYTPATGTATGTLATVSNTNSLGLISDSAQTWTTNDLAGRFLRMTNGTQSGQRRAVFANTSTSVELAHQWATLPTVGDAYVIETPSVIVNSAVTFTGNTGRVTFITDSISVEGATLAFSCFDGMGIARPQSTRVDGASSTSLTVSGCRLASSGAAGAAPAVAVSSSSGAAFLSSSTQADFALQGSNLLALGTSTSTTSILVRMSGQHSALWSGLYVHAISTSASMTLVSAAFSGRYEDSIGAGGNTPYAWVGRCAVNTQSGFVLGGPAHIPRLSTTTSPQVVFTCGTGFTAQNNLNVTLTPSCISTTTCMTATTGARLQMNATPSLVGVTNDYSVDGQVYSESVFSTFSPLRILGAGGSVIQR